MQDVAHSDLQKAQQRLLIAQRLKERLLASYSSHNQSVRLEIAQELVLVEGLINTNRDYVKQHAPAVKTEDLNTAMSGLLLGDSDLVSLLQHPLVKLAAQEYSKRHNKK